MGDNGTAAALFSQFEAEQENLLKRVHQINDTINQNRAEHAQVMAQHDQAFLAGDQAQVAQLRSEAEQLDKDYGWATREAELLSRAGAKTSPVLRRLAQQWHKVVQGEVQGLQQRWEQAVKELEEAHMAVLKATATLGRLGKKCDNIMHQYGTITTATGLNLTWIQTPNSRVDLKRQRGPMYQDPVLVTNVYKLGKVKEEA